MYVKTEKNQCNSYGISLYRKKFVVSISRMRVLKDNISIVQFTLFLVSSFMLEGSFLFTHSQNNELRIKIQL